MITLAIAACIYLFGFGYWARLAHETLEEGKELPPRTGAHWLNLFLCAVIALLWPVMLIAIAVSSFIDELQRRRGRA